MYIVLSVPLYRKIMSIVVDKKEEMYRKGHDQRTIISTSRQRYNEDGNGIESGFVLMKCYDLIFHSNDYFYSSHDTWSIEKDSVV